MQRSILPTVFALVLFSVMLAGCAELASTPATPEEIALWWKAGKTLPLETASKYPQAELRLTSDTGVNVLIDMSHKCDFFLLWTLGERVNRQGIRTIGSHATLDSVLTPGASCRVRIPVADGVNPFAWWPAPKFNVVLTEGAPQDPGYTTEEQKMLKRFIRGGGGFIVSGSTVRDQKTADEWSLNKMLSDYGAAVLPGNETYEGGRMPALQVNRDWEVVLKGETGKPIYATRQYGKGRIALLASSNMYRSAGRGGRAARAPGAAGAAGGAARPGASDPDKQIGFLADAIKWAAAGSPPVGGDTRFPTAMGGGGGIYPETEKRLEGIVCFYSKNQIPELVRTMNNDFPAITKDIYAWLPSPKPEQPMYLILCSGDGGGWAVNAYLPKEAATISTSSDGIRSIFGHEQAHTMSGPCKAADHPFGGNQGEDHAGWFQGKINARYNGDKGPNRGCNGVFRPEYDGSQKDPEQIFKKANYDAWRTGHDLLMIWYVWQKFDDRYGPTWYPRWRWVQGERWKDDPTRRLTWEESNEDMSIAVGEDLFPFFRKTGKDLSRERFEKAEFMGRTMTLPLAPIEPTPPGNVCLDPIGDYTKPILPRK